MPLQGLANALKWVKEMKEAEEELNEKLNFLSGLVAAFRHQMHPDILIKPGNDGPSLPAHRALLVTLFFLLIDFFLSFYH